MVKRSFVHIPYASDLEANIRVLLVRNSGSHSSLIVNGLELLSGLEIRILEPGAISLKIARKLLLVHFFVHKFI